MTTYPLATLSAQVTAAGITAPAYPDVLASLQASYRLIFGADVYLEPDSQDGQLLAIAALAVHDANAAAIRAYLSYSPATAQGEGLSSVVKLNGLRRLVASPSTVDLRIVGIPGTTINNGVVGDALDQRWLLPVVVVIPTAGEIVITASADTAGSRTAIANTVSRILTPTRGWQTASNASPATVGAPVESDAMLRRRQAASTALPAQAVLKAIGGAVANLTGVQRYRAYENDGATMDSRGIPAHSIAMVVEGGDAQAVAQAIARRKTPGTGTTGDTVEQVFDDAGVPSTIRFYRPVIARVRATVALRALPGYTARTADLIAQTMADYVNAQGIGASVYLTKMIGAADLGNAAGPSETFVVTSLQIARDSGSFGTADITIGFREAPALTPSDITITVS